MAKIIPFRGILYNPKKIDNLSDVVTPPYDVISKQEQNEFYERHPQNIIRLILGKTSKEDTDQNNPCTRASNFLNKWLLDGIFLQDESPAFYLTTVEFKTEDKLVTRSGLIALVALEPFEKGIVLPHERTFSKVKSERLGLMKTCHANFSPIFALYSDKQNDITNALKDTVYKKLPDLDFVDDRIERHRLWRIHDSAMHRYVAAAMQEKSLFIADGHHRYETALNYRDWILSKYSGGTEEHPANYVMMYLTGMDDPGLTILPAHRLLRGLEDRELSVFISKCENYFNVVSFPFNGDNRDKAFKKFMTDLKSSDSKNKIGVFMKNRSIFYLLTLKKNVMKKLYHDELPDSLRDLDVTVLTRLVIMEMLGFDEKRLDDERLITYLSCEKEVVDAVASGKCDLAFILNPTQIEQVRGVAEEGHTMPRKSTYFYPKVLTGQVLNILTESRNLNQCS